MIPYLIALLAVILVAIALGVWWFGSVNALIAWTQGYALTTDSRVISLGGVPSRSRQSAAFELTNITSRPVTIYGVETSCGCLVVNDLPMTLQPRQSTKLTVNVNVVERGEETSFQYKALLFLSVPSPPIVLGIEGSVTKACDGEHGGV